MTKTIQLTQGKVAIVDDDDYEWLSKHKWSLNAHGYPQRSTRQRVPVLMHRMILNTPKGMVSDHIDGDRLNNTRSNLRVCTNRENVINSRKRSDNNSGFKGVCWDKTKRKWVANIRVYGKQKFLGYFADPRDAARAYDQAALRHYGVFARINAA